MQLSFTEKKSIRKNFGKLKDVLSIPNLIEVQKKSYDQFLSSENISQANLQKGLEKVFKSFFPCFYFLNKIHLFALLKELYQEQVIFFFQ